MFVGSRSWRNVNNWQTDIINFRWREQGIIWNRFLIEWNEIILISFSFSLRNHIFFAWNDDIKKIPKYHFLFQPHIATNVVCYPRQSFMFDMTVIPIFSSRIINSVNVSIDREKGWSISHLRSDGAQKWDKSIDKNK